MRACLRGGIVRFQLRDPRGVVSHPRPLLVATVHYLGILALAVLEYAEVAPAALDARTR